MEKVLAGICGKTQFRESGQKNLTLSGLFQQGDGPAGVERGVSDLDFRKGNRGSYEIVGIHVEEFMPRAHGFLPFQKVR